MARKSDIGWSHVLVYGAIFLFVLYAVNACNQEMRDNPPHPDEYYETNHPVVGG